MKKRTIILVLVGLVGALVFSVFFLRRAGQQGTPLRVLAATGSYPAAEYLQSPDGGMAQYGYAMQQPTSPSATLQALSDWNVYISDRSQWGLSSTLTTRLASADWNARQAGPPTISAEQLAAAATNLVNAKLATMTAAEIEDGFKRMLSEMTPKGRYGLNQMYPHATAQQTADGRWVVTIAPAAFSEQKSEFARLAPGMVSSSANFYPGEAILVMYSIAAADQGYGREFIPTVRKSVADLTGLDMSQRSLFGENGYLRRRPLNTFLAEQAMSQFFSELGF